MNFKLRKRNKTLTNNADSIGQYLEDLTPQDNIDNVDKDRVYSNTIKWALENKKVNNIALTGPYGSGKSSIIKSFESQHSEYRFLNISLATFKDEEGKNENVLEKSILQQMIYKVNSATIPFSRFKRIMNYKPRFTIINLLVFFLFILSGLFLLKPQFFRDTFEKTFISESIDNGVWQSVLMSLIGILFLVCLIWMLVKIHYFVRKNINISKIGFPKVEIEIAKGTDDSIFHKYIDEIIYFFEVTSYNVVVLEDLDRFNNLDLFENLRELNTLINNSDQISRRVVFMYAIKDDIFGSKDSMFESRNRTKFFDFIVPVIPVINSSNSREVLLKKLKDTPLGKDISEEFINDITIYIDDMRTLINICNEYFTYKQKLGSIPLISNKLLAIIVYKNIYPVDFAKLQFNKGMVFQVLQRKNELIERRVNDYELRISTIERDIELVEKESLDTLDELLVVYTDALRIRERTNQNIYISLDNNTYANQLLDVSFFEELKVSKNIRYNLPGHGNGRASIDNIATVFGTKSNYFERERIIKLREQKQVEDLKRMLEYLRKEKEEIQTWSLQELIEKSDFKEVFVGEIEEKKLLIFLLRNGYIDEMYSKYITHFYPGSLTTDDMKFIMSIKDREVMPHNYKLDNISEIIKSLHGHEFKQPGVLNYDLLNHIIEHGPRTYFDSIIDQLSDASEQSLLFIDSYKELSVNKELFIKCICKKWSDMWSHIELKSNFSNEKKDMFLSDIIKYADIDDIVEMNKTNLLTEAISAKDYFFRLFTEWKYDLKLKEILLKLNVKFEKIDPSTISDNQRSMVYNNNLFKLNKVMVGFIMNNSAEEILGYSSIMNSEYPHLIEYIQQNIEEYVENVLLNLKGNIEEEERVIELLNNNDISEKNKKAIIQKQDILISDITSVQEKELWSYIVLESKMSATWNNIVRYLTARSIDPSLIHFINNEENCIHLSTSNVDEVDGFEKSILTDTSEQIILCADIQNSCFDIIAESLLQWDTFDVSRLAKSRVEIMINHELLTLTAENFNSIKQSHRNLHILLIEKNIDDFLGVQDEFELDSSDYDLLFNSRTIGIQNKNHVLKSMDPQLVSTNSKLAETTTDMVLTNSFKIEVELLDAIFKSNISDSKKLELLVGKIDHIETEEFIELLAKLNTPYSDITEHGKRPLIEDNMVNRTLAIKLKARDYISSWKEEGNKIRINTKLK